MGKIGLMGRMGLIALAAAVLLGGCAWVNWVPGIDNHKRPNLEQTAPVMAEPQKQ